MNEINEMFMSLMLAMGFMPEFDNEVVGIEVDVCNYTFHTADGAYVYIHIGQDAGIGVDLSDIGWYNMHLYKFTTINKEYKVWEQNEVLAGLRLMAMHKEEDWKEYTVECDGEVVNYQLPY